MAKSLMVSILIIYYTAIAYLLINTTYYLLDETEFKIFTFHLGFIWICTSFFSHPTLDNSSSYYLQEEECYTA